MFCPFRFQNPRFPGNLQMSNRQLDEAGENDVNNLWVLCDALIAFYLFFFLCCLVKWLKVLLTHGGGKSLKSKTQIMTWHLKLISLLKLIMATRHIRLVLHFSVDPKFRQKVPINSRVITHICFRTTVIDGLILFACNSLKPVTVMEKQTIKTVSIRSCLKMSNKILIL